MRHEVTDSPARGRAPAAAVRTAPNAILELQRAAGNAAVCRALHDQPAVQRVMATNTQQVLEPARYRWWRELTSDQRTHGLSMVNDPYRFFVFATPDAARDHLRGVTGAADPVISPRLPRKQEDKTTVDTGEDKLFDSYDPRGTGGFRPGATTGHRSNWAHYVDTQFTSAEHRLRKLVLSQNTRDQLQALRATTMRHAAVMDRLEATATTQMNVHGDTLQAAHEIEQSVNALWKWVARVKMKPREHYPRATVPRWGGLANGMGTVVTVVFHWNQALPAGSGASGTTTALDWEDSLSRRREGAIGYYVRGHLLNDHVGGPAAPYNLVPLTNAANATHVENVEKYVKQAVDVMRDDERAARDGNSPPPDPTQEIFYHVAARWDGHPRHAAGTARWDTAYQQADQIVSMLVTNNVVGANTTVEQLRDALASGAVQQSAPFLTWNNQPLTYQNIWTGFLKQPFEVVVANRAATTLDAAVAAVQDNAALWLAEDQLVPSHLDCDFAVRREQGDDVHERVVVRNDLDRMLYTQRYERRRR